MTVDPRWTEQYVGLPYEQANCWTLTRRVLAEQFNASIPAYDGTDFDAAVAHALQNHVVEVSEPRLGDVVLMQRLGRPHIGIMLDAETMLHTSKGKDAVIERLFRSRYRVTGFYRIAGR